MTDDERHFKRRYDGGDDDIENDDSAEEPMPFTAGSPAGNPVHEASEDRQPSDGHQSSEMRDESAATVSRGAGAGGSGGSVVRTVCIRGFPPDTMRRELRNLVSFFAGYEACSLVQANGFVRFASPEEASAAAKTLNGHVFDEEGQGKHSRLSVSLARRDLVDQRPGPQGSRPPSQMPGAGRSHASDSYKSRM